MKTLEDLRTAVRDSFWAVPAVTVLIAVLLALTMIEIDQVFDHNTLAAWPRLFGAGAAGSRGMLSAIAGSMITVAGVVFSVTIVALSLASSQYTSRVLRNFVRDRSNQMVLGVFVGIFAYCLVVPRTIRGGDEGAFVPGLAVLLAGALAFAGIGVLIFRGRHLRPDPAERRRQRGDAPAPSGIVGNPERRDHQRVSPSCPVAAVGSGNRGDRAQCGESHRPGCSRIVRRAGIAGAQ